MAAGGVDAVPETTVQFPAIFQFALMDPFHLTTPGTCEQVHLALRSVNADCSIKLLVILFAFLPLLVQMVL